MNPDLMEKITSGNISLGIASLVAQAVKNLPTMQETWIWSLGWKDTLKEGMATHSNSLLWRIPRTEEPGGLQPMGRKQSDTTEHAHTVIDVNKTSRLDVLTRKWRWERRSNQESTGGIPQKKLKTTKLEMCFLGSQGRKVLTKEVNTNYFNCYW